MESDMVRKGKRIARVSRCWYKKNQVKQIKAGQIMLVQRLADITEKFAVGGLLIGFFQKEEMTTVVIGLMSLLVSLLLSWRMRHVNRL
jgi:hypothetical protein